VTADDGADGPAIVENAKIKGFPTFFFFIDGVKKDELVGADAHALESMIAKHLGHPPPPDNKSTLVDARHTSQVESMASTVTQLIFPTHKPRDLGYGIKSGLYNISSGVVAGAFLQYFFFL